MKSERINLSDERSKEDETLNSEEGDNCIPRSQFGSKVSFDDSINDVRFRSKVPHKFINLLVIRAVDIIAGFKCFFLSRGFILRIVVHNFLKSGEKFFILVGLSKCMGINVTLSIPSFCITLNVASELESRVVIQNRKRLRDVLVWFFSLNSKVEQNLLFYDAKGDQH